MKRKSLGELITAQMRRRGFALARGLKESPLAVQCDDIFCPAEDFITFFIKERFEIVVDDIKVVGNVFFLGPQIDFDINNLVFPEVEIIGSIQFKQMSISGNLDLSRVTIREVLDFQTVFVGGDLMTPANFIEMEKSARPRVYIDRLRVVGRSHRMFKG